jgi:hypothetical protein
MPALTKTRDVTSKFTLSINVTSFILLSCASPFHTHDNRNVYQNMALNGADMVVRDSEPGRLVRRLYKYLVYFVHFGGSWRIFV